MKSSLRIELLGLRTTAIIGVLPEEQSRAQPLEFNIVLSLDATSSLTSDELDDTVDYGAVCSHVVMHTQQHQYQLLERLAGAIAESLFATFSKIHTIELTVTKLRPPVAEDLQSSGVTITCERS